MKKILLVTGVAVLALASVTSAAFMTNLTVGSTGSDVTALQTWLITNGFHIASVEAGTAAKGYFGSQTKAALAQYQASVGLPSTGFFGPLTQAKLNGTASAVVTVSTGCPVGYTCTANPVTTVTCPVGVTCTPNTGTTGTVVASNGTTITTPGVQGIMSVTQGPISTSVAYAGQSKVPVLDARIQAQYSDISIQSIQVDLGSSTNSYNYVYSKIYLIDPTTGNVLTSQPLNSSTVVQNGNNYVVGLAGFNFIVPKGTFKDIQIAVDLYPTVLTQFLGQITASVDQNGIRGVDGAGVNNYGPASGSISQIVTVSQTQTLTATANVSLDASSPLANAVGITNVSAGSYLGLPVLTFDVNAQGDTLHLHSVSVNIGTAGSTGSPSVNAAYLYQGSTLITSAAVTCSGTVCSTNFANIPDGTSGASVAINQTVPFTVKVDVTGAANTSFAANVIASTSAMTIYGSTDNTVNSNGSAQGNLQTVQGQGAVFNLSGTPSITKVVSNSDNAGNATDTYTATFNVTVQAIGTTVTLGLPASTTPSFGTSSTNFVNIYQNGSPIGLTNFSPVVSYSQPTNTSLSANGTSFQVGINQSVTIPVTYSFQVRNPGANVYAVQLNGINSAPNGLTSFMNGLTTWRTSSI
jgi:peptidoglycan hydrolase-like protein with peptidoglycan-binding domain